MTHYLAIARDGYNSTGDSRLLLVFYPFYPMLVHLTAFVVRNILYSAFIVSSAASLTLAVLMRRLVALDFPAPARMERSMVPLHLSYFIFSAY